MDLTTISTTPEIKLYQVYEIKKYKKQIASQIFINRYELNNKKIIINKK